MEDQSTQYSIDNKVLFDTQYVFIDGISRSGKNGILPIVCSFDNVEHFRDTFNIDRILSLFDAGHLSLEGFRYFLESDLILDSWFKLLGRDLNMNKHDVSSVSNAKNPEMYRSRLETKDTQEVFDKIKHKIESDKLIFPYATEELFVMAAYHPDIFKRIKFITVLRHPIQTIYSWQRTNRGTRYGKDMRMPHPTFSSGNLNLIPSFALKRAQEYDNEDGLGKCAIAMIESTKEYLKAIDSYKLPSVIFDFDSFTVNPQNIINDIQDFIGVKTTSHTSMALKNARIPRDIESDLFHKKAAAIFSNTNESIRNEIITLSKMYEKYFPNSPYKIKSIDSYMLDEFKNIDFTTLTPRAAYIYGVRKN